MDDWRGVLADTVGIARLLCVSFFACASACVPSSFAARPQILAHYLPWYETPEISGRWGWHWTMNHFDPNEQTDDGRRRIASHQYPLIEPYDSNDPALLECHVLLMKLAGVDGIVVDWYGADDLHDYAVLHRNTGHLFRFARRAGLTFALCYEDRTLREAVQMGIAPQDGVGSHLARALKTARDLWFDDPLYITVDGRTLLLVFGPEYAERSAWEEAFSALPTRPMFLTLGERRAFSDGAFAWPPMWKSHNGVLTLESASAYLRSFSASARDWRVAATAAFPGFNDIYAEAGAQQSYGVLDQRDGATFRETLDIAMESRAPFVQLVTWNDYGEGTVIEPTRDEGFRFLEDVQKARFRSDRRFNGVSDDLRLPVELYCARKSAGSDASAKAELDAVAEALFTGRTDDARARLARLKAVD